MTSGTDELRRLLDERGVEHYDGTESTLWGYEPTSDSTGAYRYSADETSDGYIQVQLWHVTPEQAIAATLGSCNCSNDCTNSERTETCHPIISDNLAESEGTGDAWADCSECGHLLFVLTDPNSQVPNFCPNCGRRIEQ